MSREAFETVTIDRDARNYCGDDPVIAHPPCQLWGKMANVNLRDGAVVIISPEMITDALNQH